MVKCFSNGVSAINFRTYFVDPLSSLYWWAVMVGGKKLKFASASTPSANEQAKDHHFSPHSTAKTNDKSTYLRKNGI